MKKIPYGISDFKSLIEDNYLYVDKTKYIKELEKVGSKYLFFIRPRRFGKSLLLSTLAHYYDLNNKNCFNDLFGDLYIAENPSELKTSYMILQLNFSALNTDSKEELMNSFRLTLINAIINNLHKYKNIFINIKEIEENISEIKDIKAIFEYFLKEVKNIGKKIYLIIDEYDHFANDIIAMGDSKFYKDIVHATGFVRDFYETVKIGTGSVIDRIFITGISPIMLDGLTSGFNIADNITLDRFINEMLGFTENEVNDILGEFCEEVEIDRTKEELLKELRRNYNGYLFNKDSQQRVYNPDMILNFFKQYLHNDKYPDQLIDDNVRTDYVRLNRLVENDKNRETLEKILAEDGITCDIITRFSFDMMYDREYFVSLLFYMGLLTITGIRYGKTRLEIPNFVTRVIFWEYFERKLRSDNNIEYNVEELAKSIWKMGYDGDIKPFISFISDSVIKKLS